MFSYRKFDYALDENSIFILLLDNKASQPPNICKGTIMMICLTKALCHVSLYRLLFVVATTKPNQRQWRGEKRHPEISKRHCFRLGWGNNKSCSDNEKGWEILTARYLTMTEKIVDLTCIIRWAAFMWRIFILMLLLLLLCSPISAELAKRDDVKLKTFSLGDGNGKFML